MFVIIIIIINDDDDDDDDDDDNSSIKYRTFMMHNYYNNIPRGALQYNK